MKGTYSTLMHSKFFNPAFNSAIFDGPIRIYFAQFQESMALKIYFQLQQNYTDLVAAAKSISKETNQTILVMLYPNTESFKMSFEGENPGSIQTDYLSGDSVIGVNGPVDDLHLPVILNQIKASIEEWKQAAPHPMEMNL